MSAPRTEQFLLPATSRGSRLCCSQSEGARTIVHWCSHDFALVLARFCIGIWLGHRAQCALVYLLRVGPPCLFPRVNSWLCAHYCGPMLCVCAPYVMPLAMRGSRSRLSSGLRSAERACLAPAAAEECNGHHMCRRVSCPLRHPKSFQPDRVSRFICHRLVTLSTYSLLVICNAPSTLMHA